MWILSFLLVVDVHNKIRTWMTKTNKPRSYKVWFDRCINVYFFILNYYLWGWTWPVHVLLGINFLEMALNNPWSIAKEDAYEATMKYLNDVKKELDKIEKKD
jgi:hypothetical protein